MNFDLDAARALCNQATFKATGNPINEDLKLLVDQAGMLPAALDRIAELEVALIEERANSVGSMAAMSGRLMDCIEAEKEARGQLHSEGKI